MAQAIFNYAGFAARFPEFATVAQPTITAYAAEIWVRLPTLATLTGDPGIDGRNGLLLNLATAHLTALYSGVNGNAPAELVGRIDDASQGSVHVHADAGEVPKAAVWWYQTKYGIDFWQQSQARRTFHYSPPMPRNPGVLPWRTR